MHLKTLQNSVTQLSKKKATLIAVSPEKTEYLEKTKKKTGANFLFIHDKDYRIAEAYDVAFRPKDYEVFLYNFVMRAHLKQAHSDETERLPVPATYIIASDGTIVWRHFERDYKKRSLVKDILANIP